MSAMVTFYLTSGLPAKSKGGHQCLNISTIIYEIKGPVC